MLVDMALIAVGAVLAAAASGPLQLFFGQLLVGVGIGIDFPVGAAYVSELMPQRERGRMMVATIACQSIGMLLAACNLDPHPAANRRARCVARVSGD